MTFIFLVDKNNIEDILLKLSDPKSPKRHFLSIAS